MKDLERSLDEQTESMLQAYADAWHMDLDSRSDHLAQVKSMAETMLDQAARNRVIARLSLEAVAILQEITTQEGAVPAHRIYSRYGRIRRFGPSRLERERPWTDPSNAVEELYYAGLVFRGFAVVAGQHTEVLYTPESLQSDLPPAATVYGASLIEHAEVKDPQTQQRAMAEDMLAVLARLRRAPIRTDLLPTDRLAPDADWPDLGLSGRWLGPLGSVRMALIWRLIGRLHLAEQRDGLLLPSQRARAWLRMSDSQRTVGLVAAWRDDPAWNELRYQPSLILEDTGWQSNPLVARRNLIESLAQCPVRTWIRVSSWVDSLRETQPGYMRPSGDMDSWFIREAATGEYLLGWEAWPKIEGAVARSTITRELYWLGMVDLGKSAEGDLLFRLAPEAATLWGQEMPTPEARDTSLQSDSPMATIGTDMVISVGLNESVYARYQLERFAEWQSTAERAQFKITADSVWASQTAGIKIAQILGFLDRISGGQVPDALRRALLAWGGRFGRVFVRRALVLQTVDSETMLQLRRRTDIADLLGTDLSPTACFVAEENIPELTARLKRIGIWPHIKL